MCNLIPDEKLALIKVRDNREKLVNLKKLCPEIIVRMDHEAVKLEGFKSDECYVREGVAKRLCAAAKSLPDGIKLVVTDGYRTIEAQRRMHMRLVRNLKRKHPDWSEEKVIATADLYVANPDEIVLHPTGGAVDLTLAGPDGKKLDMGSEIDAFLSKSSFDSHRISKAARKNRRLLKKVMEAQGFVNYPLEWWHWSYGDAYWAAKLKKRFAIYGVVYFSKK
jgi:D-alanyl-D-alanine dipeptidase